MKKIISNESNEENLCNSVSSISYFMKNSNKKESKYIIENKETNIFESSINGDFIIIIIYDDYITLYDLSNGISKNIFHKFFSDYKNNY